MNAPTKIEASLTSAMAAAFAEIDAASKSANNPHFKSKYADLTSVIDAIKPALVKHGLFFTQHPKPCDGGVQVATVLHHASGDSMALGELFVPANRNDAQAYGSALTYARRYALVTAFGVPTEDDDGNAASKNAPAAKTGKPAKPQAHSALKTAYRQFVHEANGCGDGDELSAFLATADAVKLVSEIREKLPHIWDGNNWPEGSERPDEWEPLADFITRRQRECAAATAQYMNA